MIKGKTSARINEGKNTGVLVRVVGWCSFFWWRFSRDRNDRSVSIRGLEEVSMSKKKIWWKRLRDLFGEEF